MERELHTEIGVYFEAVGPNLRPAENLEDFGECSAFCYAVICAVFAHGSVTAFCSRAPCLFFGHQGRGRNDSAGATWVRSRTGETCLVDRF